MADSGERGKDGNTKIWISQEQKELFTWHKKHFSWFFEGLSFGEKKIIKIADQSFEVSIHKVFHQQ